MSLIYSIAIRILFSPLVHAHEAVLEINIFALQLPGPRTPPFAASAEKQNGKQTLRKSKGMRNTFFFMINKFDLDKIK